MGGPYWQKEENQVAVVNASSIIKISALAGAIALAGCGGLGGNSGGGITRASNMAEHWSFEAIDTSGRDHWPTSAKENPGPTRASRAMAIVHIAMHDAIQAIQRRYETYLPQQPASKTASVEAAAAQAAHDTMCALYPSQKADITSKLAYDLAQIKDGASKAEGIEVGKRAAAAILADRANDGSDPVSQGTAYVVGQLPGFWRPDPINPNQQALGPNWYKVRPFVMKSASQFRAAPPPSIGSKEYAEAYEEVLRLGGDGITTPTERNADQTVAGIYWAYDGTPSLCAPPRLYDQLVCKVLQDNGISEIGEVARVLALVNIAMADAGIASWETKYYYNYWRPITGIREADAGTGPSGIGDGNPFTKGDANWTPLGAPASNLANNNFTPPFPAYVSGHATFGGAIFQVLREYFGRDDIAFTFISDEYNGETLDNHGVPRPLLPRHFSSFSQAEEENGQSRIYLGIHWRFDKTEGIKMGNQVARYVVSNILKPLR